LETGHRDGAACLGWLREWQKRRQVLPSAFNRRRRGHLLAQALAPSPFDYLGDYGYCGSAVACGIGMFLKNFRGRTLLHINRDPRGNYAILEVEVF
jgi:hypothetical protein